MILCFPRELAGESQTWRKSSNSGRNLAVSPTHGSEGCEITESFRHRPTERRAFLSSQLSLVWKQRKSESCLCWTRLSTKCPNVTKGKQKPRGLYNAGGRTQVFQKIPIHCEWAMKIVWAQLQSIWKKGQKPPWKWNRISWFLLPSYEMLKGESKKHESIFFF